MSVECMDIALGSCEMTASVPKHNASVCEINRLP